MTPEPDDQGCEVKLDSSWGSSALYELWKAEQLCDVDLIADDGTIVPAHKVVLASASSFFSALFAGAGSQMAEAGAVRVTLPGVDGKSLRQVVAAVYTASVRLDTFEAVEQLVAASSYLQVLPLRNACCAHLRRRLSLTSAAPTLALACLHDCSDLAAAAQGYLQGRLPQLLRSPAAAASLAALPADVLAGLLSSDGLEVNSELDVAQAALHWAAADPQGRAGELPSLLAAARLPPAELLARAPSLAWGDLPAGAEPVLRPALEAACGASLLALQQQAGSGGGAASSAAGAAGVAVYRQRQSTPTALLVAGGLDEGWRPLKTVELYDPVTDRWSMGQAMPAPMQFACGAALGPAAAGGGGGDSTVGSSSCCTGPMLVEGAAAAPSVLAFDKHTKCWRACPRPLKPRVNMGVAGLGGCLYLLGGRAGVGKGARALQDVERYNPRTQRWQRVADMGLPRTSLGAAALGDRLYVVGGQSDRDTHASGECYDPATDTWLSLGGTAGGGRGALAAPRKYHSLVAAGDRLLAVGGLTAARTRLASVEAFDPREGRWQVLPPLAEPRSSIGVAALGADVYVVGGHTGSTSGGEVTNRVECLSLTAGAWRPCAPICVGRSGLAAVPV